jgi:hypothetical protein
MGQMQVGMAATLRTLQLSQLRIWVSNGPRFTPSLPLAVVGARSWRWWGLGIRLELELQPQKGRQIALNKVNSKTTYRAAGTTRLVFLALVYSIA